MHGHKRVGEAGRTGPVAAAAAAPASVADLDAFRAYHAQTVEFTDALRERRCRRTHHFDAHLGDTVAAFRPLFSPWNMEILFLLYMRGPQRFNALKRGLAGVSSRVLTDKLRHLEAYGLLHRDEDPEAGVVNYRLSDEGGVVARQLHPILFYLRNAHALGTR